MSYLLLDFILKRSNSEPPSYLIKVGLGLGEDARVALVLFDLCLLSCQSLEEILLRNILKSPNTFFIKIYTYLYGIFLSCPIVPLDF